jgi:4-hydroxybenzoate polyprenyltransferase
MIEMKGQSTGSDADLEQGRGPQAEGQPDVATGTSSGVRPAWTRSLRGYVLLPHFVPVLVVELATMAFAVVAWSGFPPWRLLVPLVLAMLGGQLAIGALNELVDLPLDTVAKPWKPLPSGMVRVAGARAMVAVGLGMMTVFGLLFGAQAFALLAVGTGLGLGYDLWFKRTSWSWLPYLLALPLLPIWIFTALGQADTRLFFLYPLGALAVIGIHFAQALPDTVLDRAAGLHTITSRLGLWRTFILAWMAALSAPVLAWIFATKTAERGAADGIGLVAVGAVGLMLVNVVLLAKRPAWGAKVCFPLVAAVTLISGLVWTMAVGR